MPYQKYLVATVIACLPAIAMGQDPTIDRLVASQCAQCHGTDGYATGDIDKITGKGVADLYDKLLGMKKEDQAEDVMDHQAWGYTDEQLYRIARYYSTLPESNEEEPESEFEPEEDEPESH